MTTRTIPRPRYIRVRPVPPRLPPQVVADALAALLLAERAAERRWAAVLAEVGG